MVEDGESIPKPSSLDNIIKLPEAKGRIPLFVTILVN
jgi:hypothetical protein